MSETEKVIEPTVDVTPKEEIPLEQPIVFDSAEEFESITGVCTNCDGKGRIGTPICEVCEGTGKTK